MSVQPARRFSVSRRCMQLIDTSPLRFRSPSIRALLMVGWLVIQGSLAPAADFDPQPDPPSRARPVHWWSGDGHARDQVGAVHGTLVGGARFAPGIRGMAFEFDGVDDAVVFGVEAGNFGAYDFSVELMLRSPVAALSTILGKRETCTHNSFWDIRSTLVELDETTGGRNYVQARLPESLGDRVWHHLVLRREGTVVSVYQDGVRVFNRTNSFITRISNLSPVIAGKGICAGSSDRPFQGLIDEIKLYDVALSPEQIAEAAQAVAILQIRGQPKGATFKTNALSHTLVVDAFSPQSRSLRYQWFLDGRALEGATRASYTVAPVDRRTEGRYTVVVSDGVTEVRSEPATVFIGPAALIPRPPQLVQEPGADGPARLKWILDPPDDRAFAASDVQGIDLEVSSDLKFWSVIPGAARLVNGKVEVLDAEAFSQRHAYYRIAYRDPAGAREVGGGVALATVPAAVVTEAQEHIRSFLEAEDGPSPEDAGWTDVVFGSTARHLYDPAHQDGKQPAFLELKVLDRLTRQPRGYILLSITGARPQVLEFSMTGLTKTERALEEYPGQKPQKFMRFTPGFLALEDAAGNMIGSLGTLPAMPEGEAPTEAQTFEGFYDSENGVLNKVDAVLHKPFSPVAHYASLRSAFAANPTRVALRQLRSSALTSRLSQLGGLLRNRILLVEGETREIPTDGSLATLRVDAEIDLLPSVRVQALPRGGFTVTALRVGTDILRARLVTGAVLSYTVVVAPKAGAVARIAGLQGNCHQVKVHTWKAGTGWDGDQRLYRQLKSPLWCPVVGCGPTALLMLFGWWDVNGVPSALYHLKQGYGDADDFRFDLQSLRLSDAPKSLPSGSLTNVGPIQVYQPSPQEVVVRPVLRDLYDLCNTFCVAGQGATTPDELFDGATEYIDRAVRNLSAPEDEFGDKFMGAVLRVKYTDGYAFGMTDWEGGGAMVANDIKEGRPGIVGLGDTLFDLHYALAFRYRRVDTFEGCGSNRELVDRRRWFFCNMGWGSNHDPEWHDAESVWFGMTANLWQRKLP